MTGAQNEERPPLGTEGDRNFPKLMPASDADLPNIERNDDAGEQNCLLSFLRGWSESGPWWPTAIPREGGGAITTTITDPAKLIEWINLRIGTDNLYFHVNDLSPNTRKKGDKGDVTRIRGLHVDIDPRPPEGGWPQSEPSSEQLTMLREHCASEHARIARLVVEGAYWPAAIPRPTAVVDSGGGYQCFWRLHDDEVVAPDTAEALNRMLAAMLDGDEAVVDVSRIMRLPGAVNLPGKKKRWRGRIDAPTRLVLVDWPRRFRRADFPVPVHSGHPGGSPTTGRHAAINSAPALNINLDDLPLSDRIKALIVQGRDPDEPERYASRSEAYWAVICAMLRAGCTEVQMLGVSLDPDFGISGHVLEQPRPQKYAARQIERARAEADDSFDCDKEGRPLSSSQRNIRLAMRKLGVLVRHDLFAGRDRIAGLDGFGPPLDDAAANRLWLLIDERFRFRPSRDLFLTVLSDAARQIAFHPVAEYLAGLRWDGIPRIEGWLPTYAGAADTTYVQAVGELILVAAVRRVRQPGVKFDEMLVLESPQGTNKSTALKVLAVRDDWFTDDLPLNAEAKRVIEALSGKWIVEAGELKGMRQGGANHLKGLLSRTHDKARMAYDRLEREVPRQCVIVGTTNDSRYLRDLTGNRRFWPVAVTGFDLDALRRDRDQLWAEAAAREADGRAIRLDPALWSDAALEQDARRVEDPFFESLHSVLGEEMAGKIRAADAWRILGGLAAMRKQDDMERLGDAMRRLGFDRVKRRFGLPNPEWCYVRGDGVLRIMLEVDLDGLDIRAYLEGDERRDPF